jgi:hypothetical protein
MPGRTGRIAIAGGLGALLVTGLACGLWWPRSGSGGDPGAELPAAPPASKAKPQTPQQIAAYVGSKDFAALGLDQRVAYLDSLNKTDPNVVRSVMESDAVSKEQQDLVRKNVGEVFRQRTAQHVEAYTALPPEQRQAYLDKVIDELEARRLVRKPSASGSGDPAGGGSGKAERPVNPSEIVSRIRSRLETTDPADRAKHIQFLIGMRGRMTQRGLEPAMAGPGGLPPR